MKTYYPVSSDMRYTVDREHCDQGSPIFVARFRGDQIGQSRFYTSAAGMAIGHNARRNGALVVTEMKESH